MEESIFIITITDVFATAQRVIACLSLHVVDDQVRNDFWKHPRTYELSIQRAGTTDYVDIPLTEDTITYTNEIPAVIFHVESVESRVGDWFKLAYPNPATGELQTFETMVGSEPGSEPGELDCCEDVLSRVSGLEEQVGTIDNTIQPLAVKEIPAIQSSIAELQKQVATLDGWIGELMHKDIPDIKVLLKELVDANTDTEVDHLEKINKELIADREQISKLPPGEPADDEEQAVKNGLVNTIIDNWKEILDLVKEAQKSAAISPTAKNKIERLRAEVGRHLAYYGHLKQRIALNSKLVKVQILKRDELSRLNTAVESSR